MEECPCKNCIVLAICLARSKRSKELFIAHVGANCELFRNYVMKPGNSTKTLVVNIDNANEAGKIFGFEVVGRRVKKRDNSKEKEKNE